MGFLITLGVWAALWVIDYALRKSTAEESDTHSIEPIPRTEEGTSIPMAFGRVKIEAPNVIWFGNGNTHTGSVGPSPGVPVYSFYGNVQFALCLSNVPVDDPDYTYDAELLRVWLGGEALPPGSLWMRTDAPSPTGVPLAQPAGVTMFKLETNMAPFGSSQPSIGGIVEFNAGRWTSTMPSIMEYVLDKAGIDSAYIPPYQGTVTALLGEYTGQTTGVTYFDYTFRFGNTPTPPSFAFELIVPCRIPGVDRSITEFNDGDANPIAVLYMILTRGWGRPGVDPAKIDLASFEAAANTCYLEQNGMSGIVYRSETMESLIGKICDQIEGVVYEDPQTLQLTVKLIREADVADLGELDVLTDEDLVNPELVTSTYASTRNQVWVKFTNRAKNYKSDAVQQHDQANYEVTGTVRDMTYDLPYVTNATNASKIATRLLGANARPLAKLKAGVVRRTVFWTPGKPFIYTHPTNGKTFVMRVTRVDVGATAEEVTIDALQDRFSYDRVIALPPIIGVPLPAVPPAPPTVKDITESPRWLALLAWGRSQGGDPDRPRMMYLAGDGGDASGYRGVAAETLDGGSTSPVATATLTTAYGRENDPFDTTVGIEIEGLVGWEPATATSADVRLSGRNLLQIGTGPDAEIVGYLTATDLGGGAWRLDDVYRGLLDTTPKDHAAGVPIFVLDTVPVEHPDSICGKLGSREMVLDDVLDGKIVGERNGIHGPIDDTPAVEVTIRGRTWLPYPVADLEIDGEKLLPTPWEDEGRTLTWRRRDRLRATILPGDAVDEVPAEATTYAIYAQKGDETEQLIATGIADVEKFIVAAAPAGHGAITLGVRSEREVDLGGGLSLTYESWQDATITSTFKSWRNVLLNTSYSVDGASSLSGWTTVSGTPVVTSGGPYLGQQAVIGTSGDAPTAWRQEVSVPGYRPRGMRALLAFKIKGLLSDTDDTVDSTLSSYDGSTLLQDETSPAAEVAGATWTRVTAEIARLDDATDKLRVDFVQTGVDEITARPNGAVADACLRLGQFTDELFDASLAATTGWTVSAGSFTTGSSNPARGSAYVEGGSNTTNTMYREATVTDGYAYGEAVFEVGVRYPRPGDFTGTATVTIEARSSGGTVLASMSRTAVALEGWWRTRVYCDVPLAATTIRVTLTSTAATASANHVQWNDGAVRIFKHLDPDHELTFDFGDQAEQDLPTTAYQWKVQHPTVTPPDYGMFVGTMIGALGVEPTLRVQAGAYLSNVNTPARHDAYEFRASGVVHVRDDAYANFTSTDDFTVRVVLSDLVGGTHGVCGRLGTTGWSIDISGGAARARLVGTDGTATATAAIDLRTATFIALIHDATANTLRIVTPLASSSTSTASIGEFACDELIPLCFGDHTNVTPSAMTGTIARVELWESAIAYASLQAIWTWGSAPWAVSGNIADTLASASSVAAVVGSDSGGILIGEFAAGAGAWAEVGGVRGVPLCGNRTSLVNPNVNTSADWSAFGSPTITTSYDKAPNGRYEAVRIVGSATAGRRLDVGLNNALPLNASFCVRAPTAGTGYLTVIESDGTAASDPIPFAVTTTWTRVDIVAETIYPGSAPAALVWFPGATASTLDLAGPLWVDQDATNSTPPVAIPTVEAGSAQSYLTIEALALDAQHHAEGEIEIEAITLRPTLEAGTLARLVSNGSDHHKLYAAAGQTLFSHRTSTGTEVISEVTEAADWDEAKTVRGRWNRAGLLDAANAFAGLVSTAGADYDRTATWTAGSSGYDSIEIGHASGANAFNGLVSRLTVRSREELLPIA